MAFAFGIHFGNIYMPAQVFAIKKTFCLCRTNQRNLDEEGDTMENIFDWYCRNQSVINNLKLDKDPFPGGWAS